MNVTGTDEQRALRAAGDDMAAGEAATMAKYAAAEAGVRTIDQAIRALEDTPATPTRQGFADA